MRAGIALLAEVALEGVDRNPGGQDNIALVAIPHNTPLGKLPMRSE